MTRGTPNPTSCTEGSFSSICGSSGSFDGGNCATPDSPSPLRHHLVSLFPTFPPSSTPSAPLLHLALRGRSRLPSNDALLLTSKPTNFALFRENPQQKAPFFAPPGHLPRINTGIRTGNTICCALYLTDPTEGVTFTTATPQETFGSPYFFIAFLPPTPSPPGHPRSSKQRRSRLKNRAQTH